MEAQDMIQRIRELKKQHYQQFNEVDLILETTPRDSRYSTQLVELMRNEETALAQDSQSSVALSLIQRVENSLSNETKGFFQNVVKHNAKKLSMLRENYTQDRQRIKMDFNRGMNTQNSNLSHNTLLHNNTSGNNHNSSAIEREEERLLADYYNNWKQYESLHLQEAFQAQGCKIDNEWGKQEQSLKEEYYTKKAGLLGTTPHALMANTNETTANNSSNTMNRQFHNAEKQKTLIHTAPVFSPTRAVMKPSNKNQLELQQLEQFYQENLRSMNKQKSDAKRWLKRQELRLTIQIDELTKEKNFVGQMLTEEYQDLLMLLNAINNQSKS